MSEDSNPNQLFYLSNLMVKGGISIIGVLEKKNSSPNVCRD
jgi:hypothetical protein